MTEAEDIVEAWKKRFAKPQFKEYSGHKKKVQSCQWNLTGESLATTSVDMTVRIWHPLDRKHEKELELRGHKDNVEQCRWNPKSPDELATCSSDKTLRLWDTRVGKLAQTQTTNGENINIDWSPDGMVIAVGNKADQIQFFDVRNWKTLRTVQFRFVINEIRWNHLGNFFLLSSGSGSIHVLRWPELQSYKEIFAHTGSIYCLEMDPTGRFMAAGSADSLVTLWDQRELACVRAINHFDHPCRTMSFSSDGSLIAMAYEEYMLDIAHVDSGEQIYSLKCASNLNAVDWHPKQPLLAYAGDEKDKRGHPCFKILSCHHW